MFFAALSIYPPRLDRFTIVRCRDAHRRLMPSIFSRVGRDRFNSDRLGYGDARFPLFVQINAHYRLF